MKEFALVKKKVMRMRMMIGVQFYDSNEEKCVSVV